MYIGARIKEARELMGITQAEFARRLDVERATVGGWEAGHYSPSIDRLPRMAEVLGVTTDALLIPESAQGEVA